MNSRMFQDKMAAAKERRAQMIKRNTDQLVQSLGIVDQLAGMTYAEKLTDISIRLARLQSGIATLREQWQARYDAWKVEFDEEMQKAGRAERSLILAGQRYAMACVLEELDALFPLEVINEEKAS